MYGYTLVSDLQHWTGTTCEVESRLPYQLEDVNDDVMLEAPVPIPQHLPCIEKENDFYAP